MPPIKNYKSKTKMHVQCPKFLRNVIYLSHAYTHFMIIVMKLELDRKTDVTGLIWISIPEIMLLGLGDMPQLMSTSL